MKEEKKDKADGIILPEEEKMPFPFAVKESLFPFAVFIGYIAALRYAGFLVSTILLSLAMLFYMNRKNKIRNIIFSAVFPLVVYLLFVKVLNIRLQVGIFFGGR